MAALFVVPVSAVALAVPTLAVGTMSDHEVTDLIVTASSALDRAVEAANRAGWALRSERRDYMRKLGDMAVDLDRLWRDLERAGA